MTAKLSSKKNARKFSRSTFDHSKIFQKVKSEQCAERSGRRLTRWADVDVDIVDNVLDGFNNSLENATVGKFSFEHGAGKVLCFS